MKRIRYKVGCDLPGKYRVALDSDAWEFGGRGRVGHDVDHFTSPEGIPGVPETNFNNRPNSFKILSAARTCVVYYRVEEKEGNHNSSDIGAANETLTDIAKLGDFEGINETSPADAVAKQEDLKAAQPSLIADDIATKANTETEEIEEETSDDK